MKNEKRGNDFNCKNNSKDNNDKINDSAKAEADDAADENTEDINYDDLIKQLGILNLSIDTIYIVIIATLMNLDFLNHQKGKVLDTINNTNFFEEERDLSEESKMANKLFLYSTCIFLGINLYTLQQLLSVDSNKRDEAEINRTKKRIVSSILILISTRITKSILDL